MQVKQVGEEVVVFKMDVVLHMGDPLTLYIHCFNGQAVLMGKHRHKCFLKCMRYLNTNSLVIPRVLPFSSFT